MNLKENWNSNLDPEEYFSSGKLYIFGGFYNPKEDHIFNIKYGSGRKHLWVEGEGKIHYPKAGNCYMCIEVIKRPLDTLDGREGHLMTLIKFLSPDNLVVIDSVRLVSARIMERWKIAE